MKRSIELTNILNSHKLQGYGAEIGVAHGNFSKNILSHWSGHLYLVDCWEYTSEYRYQNQDENYKATLENIDIYKNRVTIVKKFSKDAAIDFVDDYFDFIYIDADHTYQAVKEDLQLWWPKLKKGGLFSGHDYLDGQSHHRTFGVKSAVDEFSKIVNTKINIIDDTFPSWWIFKK